MLRITAFGFTQRELLHSAAELLIGGFPGPVSRPCGFAVPQEIVLCVPPGFGLELLLTLGPPAPEEFEVST